MATTNAALEKKLDKALGALDTLLQAEAARVEREKEMKDKIDDHHALLYGNGQAGLKTDVARLSDKVSDMLIRWNIVAGLVGVQIVALVWGLLTHTFSFGP